MHTFRDIQPPRNISDILYNNFSIRLFYEFFEVCKLDVLHRNTTNDSVINSRATMYKKIAFTFHNKNVNYSNTNSNSNQI